VRRCELRKTTPNAGVIKKPNNVIDSDSKKRRDEGATPFAAGYGERWACWTAAVLLTGFP